MDLVGGEDWDMQKKWPNKSLEPTPDGAGISVFAGHVTGPASAKQCRETVVLTAWLSLGR